MAFERLWERHYPELLRRSLIWMNGRHQDAEDALGQAALVACQRFPRSLGPEDARHWLLRLVYTKCMDLHRHHKQATRHLVPGVEMTSLASAAMTPSLEAAGLEAELLEFVTSCVHQLPPPLRVVAELHLLGDMPYAETADRLDLSEVNVRKRVQQARRILRQQLKNYLAGDVVLRRPAAVGPAGGGGGRAEPERRPAARPARWSVASLTAYVERHPRGWKKRWELAQRLCEEGRLEEAAVQLRAAAERQPRRVDLWIALGQALCELGRTEDALSVYDKALASARSEASRHRILNGIAGCHGRTQAAPEDR